MRVKRVVYLAIAVAALIATYIEHRLALEGVIARCDTDGGARTISACTELIRRDPTDGIAYYNRGNGYQGIDDRARAIADYTKAIEINPFYAAAYNSRGYAYLQTEITKKPLLTSVRRSRSIPSTLWPTTIEPGFTRRSGGLLRVFRTSRSPFCCSLWTRAPSTPADIFSRHSAETTKQSPTSGVRRCRTPKIKTARKR